MAAIQQARGEGRQLSPGAQGREDVQEKELLPSEEVMAAGYLPRVLTTTDLSMIFIAVILFIANAAVVPGAGAAAFIYWTLGFITFLIPCALIVAELGLAFPGEGSVYLWITRTLGSFWGFFAGFCHWFPGVLVMVATSDVVITILQSLYPAWLQEPWQQGLVILAVLVFSCILAVLPLRPVQTLVNLVVSTYLVAIFLVGAAGFVWLLRGHLPQQDFSSGSWHLNSGNWSFYGTVILALLGVELPLTMGSEIRQRASITRHLAWGAVGIIVAYLLGTFGVMMVVPASEVGSPSAVSDAVGIVFGKSLGTVVSLVILLFFVFNTALYNYLFARMLMVASLDRRVPAKLALLNNFQQPWVAVVCQTIIAAIFTFAAFIVVPYVIESGQMAGNLTGEVYNVFQAAVTIVWCIAMLFLFIAAPVARRKLRAQGRLTTLIPSWLLGLSAVVGVLASFTGIWTTLTGSWVPSLIPSDRWWYIVIVACFAGLDIGLLLTFFLTGRPAVDTLRPREPHLGISATSIRSLPPAAPRYSPDLTTTPRPPSQPIYPPARPLRSPSAPVYPPQPSRNTPSQPIYPPRQPVYPPNVRPRGRY